MTRTISMGDVIIGGGNPFVLIAGPCVVEQAIGIDDWSRLIEDPAAAREIFGWEWYGHGGSPYRLTIQDGYVTGIEEIYLP